MEVLPREEMPEETKWDLGDIYADDREFEAALGDAAGLAERITSYQGRLSESAETLLEYMRLDDEVSLAFSRLINYSGRKSDEDTRVSRYTGYSDQVMALYAQVSASASWVPSELNSIPDADIEEMLSSNPELAVYRRAIERVRRMRPHILSAPEERLLASATEMAQVPGNAFSLMNNADMTFSDAVDSEGQSHPVTQGTYIPLMISRDRTLRKSAFESLYAGYEAFRNTLAAMLSGQTKQLAFYARARGYDSALEAALFPNEIPVEVYTNLVDAVRSGLPSMHRYIELRKRMLGVDELHFYDLYTPMVDDVSMSFTYEQACQTMLQALEPLGQEYLDVVREGLSSRWIDVYENVGKRSGAYSAGGYGMKPHILMNFHGTLDDVFTLVHEMGHSMHTYLSCQTQPVCYSDYVIFVAEVASTVNEALLMEHLLGRADDVRQRAYLLNHNLEQFRATLFRQCMFAEFELAINEMTAKGQPITADSLCEMYLQLNRDYFGDGIVLNDQIAMEWARIPHFYYDFYVYQYSTGYAAAVALSQRLLSGDPGALDDYLGFLHAGSSKPPIDILRGAGVDMSTPYPVQNALSRFESLLGEMEGLASELGR